MAKLAIDTDELRYRVLAGIETLCGLRLGGVGACFEKIKGSLHLAAASVRRLTSEKSSWYS